MTVRLKKCECIDCVDQVDACGCSGDCDGAVFYTHPEPAEVTEPAGTSFFVELEDDIGAIYQWQIYDAIEEAWVDLEDDDIYSGTSEDTLTLASSTFEMNGSMYRCRVIMDECPKFSDGALLTVNECIEVEPGDVSEDSPYEVAIDVTGVCTDDTFDDLQIAATLTFEPGPWTFGVGGSGSGIMGGRDTIFKITGASGTWISGGGSQGTIQSIAILFATAPIPGGNSPEENMGQCPTSGGSFAITSAVVMVDGVAKTFTFADQGPIYGPCLVDNGNGPCP